MSEEPKKRIRIPKTELEKHEGWLENLKNEQKSMKTSLDKCIQYKWTKDPKKVQEILDFVFETDSHPAKSRQTMREWKPTGLLGKKEAMK